MLFRTEALYVFSRKKAVNTSTELEPRRKAFGSSFHGETLGASEHRASLKLGI
ncbi:unnamed protein product [Penicillium nalgiovense]|nr:unnamed protein product [Penicillium nalgiovense]